MKPDAYRVAYEAALTEITEIARRFEQLRARKNLVENLMVALHEVFPAETAETAATAPANRSGSEPAPSPVPANEAEPEQEMSYSYLQVPNPLPQRDGNAYCGRVKTSFRWKGLAAQRS